MQTSTTPEKLPLTNTFPLFPSTCKILSQAQPPLPQFADLSSNLMPAMTEPKENSFPQPIPASIHPD